MAPTQKKDDFSDLMKKQNVAPTQNVEIKQKAPQGGGFSDLLKKQKAENIGKWVCTECTLSNVPSASKCIACEAPNPKAPIPTSAKIEPPKFTFGVSTTTSTPSNKAEFEISIVTIL